MRTLTSLRRRYQEVSLDEKRLLRRALMVVVATRVGLWCGGLRLARLASLVTARGTGRVSIDRATWAVAAAARYAPGATCLVQALALQALLAISGVTCNVHVGVVTNRSGAAGVEAHAWAVCDGRVVIGASPNDYTQLGALDRDGHVV